MAKTLTYRLFGIGKIPAPLMAELNQEGLVVVDEGVGGSATYRNFRAPGRAASLRRTWFTASIAVTNTRLLALSFSNTIINVPLNDQRIKQLHYTLEDGAALCIAFDAGLFHMDWSGKLEYRFRTPLGQQIIELLSS
jgi:hypothetical protein